MTTLDLTRTSFGSTSIAARARDAFATVTQNVNAWNQARMTRNALSKLTARELEDIGLIPADIQNIKVTK